MMGSEGGMVFGSALMWVFWVLLILLLAAILRALMGRSSSADTDGRETPLEIFRKRYARGEIDEQELERRRRELEK